MINNKMNVNEELKENNFSEFDQADPEHFRSLMFHCDTITGMCFNPNM